MRRARTGTLLAAAALLAGLLGAGGSAMRRGRRGRAGRRAAWAAGGAAPGLVPTADDCDTGVSLPPAQQAGARIQEIRKRGYLVVGVDQSAYNWGYRDSLSGKIEGFDIDLARAVAKSVLGDENKLVLKTIATATGSSCSSSSPSRST